MRIQLASLLALSVCFAACGGGDEGGETTADPDTGSAVVDTGTPTTDTGTAEDTSIVDSSPEDTSMPTDTGTAPTDTGTAPTDTGTAPTDTGTAPTDTGTAPTDTGTAPTDTGTAPTDTGTAPTDTGTAPTDTGSAPDTAVADTTPADTGSVTDTGTADTGGCTADSACTDGKICVTGTCRYAATCKELHTLRPALASGMYMIDFASTTAPAFSAYCDMTTAGGGWTRIAHIQAGDREISSVYRGDRFFHKPWRQHPTNFSIYSDNSSVALDGAAPGMLDARSQFKAGTELRFSCRDITRSLTGDAYHTLNDLEATEWLSTLIYTPAGNTWSFSTNGAPFTSATVYPTAAPQNYWGCWHICGSCGPQGPNGFQLGVCSTPPTVSDPDAPAVINQVAIGYHDGYAGIRLECTMNTPTSTAISNGYMFAWVR